MERLEHGKNKFTAAKPCDWAREMGVSCSSYSGRHSVEQNAADDIMEQRLPEVLTGRGYERSANDKWVLKTSDAGSTS